MRKKIFRTILAGLLIVSLLVVPAYAEGARVTGSDVNVRSGPGTNYRVVDCLPLGSSVTVTDRSNSEWYAISYGNTTGYMSSDYLKITEDSNVPVVSAKGTGQINAMYVRFRSGPSAGSSVLGEYNIGKTVTITGTSGDWTACTIDGRDGYVFSDYITEIDGDSTAPVSEPDSGSAIIVIDGSGYTPPQETDAPVTVETPAPVRTESPSGAVVIVGGQQAPSTPSPTPTPTPKPNQEPYYGAIVIIGAYQAPSLPAATPSPTPAATPTPTPTATPAPTPAATPSPRLTATPAPVQTIVPVATPRPTPTPTTTSAPAQTSGGGDGIVVVGPTPTPAPSSTPTPTPAPTPTATPAPTPSVQPTEARPGVINGDYVRFRTGPDTTYSIIDTYNTGKTLTITGTSGEWTACTIDEKDGFVFSTYVKEVDSAQQPEEDPTEIVEPIQTEPPVETEPPQIENPQSTPGYITGNNVRLRETPSMSSAILVELFYGNTVTITGTSGEWTAVTYGDTSGFVYSSYVKEGEYAQVSSGGSDLGRQIADYALQFVGYNYTWGGTSPSEGFDCSGLMYYVYQQFGYTLNRVACDQARNGVHVDPSDLQPGDLLCFYSSGSYIGHVGMYIGNNMFVHAANSRSGVITTELSGYYSSRGYEARRII